MECCFRTESKQSLESALQIYITNKRAGNQEVKQVQNVMSEIGEHIRIGTEKIRIVLQKIVKGECESECQSEAECVGKVAHDTIV